MADRVASRILGRPDEWLRRLVFGLRFDDTPAHDYRSRHAEYRDGSRREDASIRGRGIRNHQFGGDVDGIGRNNLQYWPLYRSRDRANGHDHGDERRFDQRERNGDGNGDRFCRWRNRRIGEPFDEYLDFGSYRAIHSCGYRHNQHCRLLGGDRRFDFLDRTLYRAHLRRHGDNHRSKRR